MGLLAFAGSISGMGQGLERGLSQMQALHGSNMLAEESDKRLTAREDRAYSRRRFDIEEERKYNEILRRKLFEESETQKDEMAEHDLSRRERTLGKKASIEEREYEEGKGLRTKRREEDTDAEIRKKDRTVSSDLQREEDTLEQSSRVARKKFESGKPIRTAERREKIEGAIEETTSLAGSDDYVKGQRTLADAKESGSQRAQAEAIRFKLQQDQKMATYQDELVSAIKSNDPAAIKTAADAYTAAAGKWLEAQKTDLASATAGMRETGTEITRLSTVLKDLMPGDPAYEATKRRLAEAEAMHRAFTAHVAKLSGTAGIDTQAKGPVQIKDRFAPGQKESPPGGMIAEAQKEKAPPATPAPSGPTALGRMGEAVMGAITPFGGGPTPTPPAPANTRTVPQAAPGEQERMMAAVQGQEPTPDPRDLRPRERTVPSSAGERERMMAAVQGDERPSGMIAKAQEPQALPSEEGRDTRLAQILQGHEGFRGKPYQDKSGKTTIGYGRNLDDKPLTPKQAQRLMEDDIGDARQEASRLPYYERLDPVRQDAVTALVYNMGLKGVQGFKRFNAAMDAGDWQRARQELLNSDWAKQVGPERASTMAQMILTGRYTS